MQVEKKNSERATSFCTITLFKFFKSWDDSFKNNHERFLKTAERRTVAMISKLAASSEHLLIVAPGWIEQSHL